MSRIVHGTLVANTPTLVDLDDVVKTIEVVIVANAAPIYFRVDGVAPTVKGNDCEVVVGGIGASLAITVPRAAQVQLISVGTPDYCVRGV